MGRRLALADRLRSLVKPGRWSDADVRALLGGNRTLLCCHDVDTIRWLLSTVVGELLHLLYLLLLLWPSLGEEDLAARAP